MKEPMSDFKKWIIGGAITAVIILLIIWYRNSQKNKQAELSKSKLVSGSNTTAPIVNTDIGKTALVKSGGADFYSTDGNFTKVFTKTTAGEYAGSVLAVKTDSGNTAFYKVVNTSGTKLYVLKTQVTLK